jgi:hypothetical protein
MKSILGGVEGETLDKEFGLAIVLVGDGWGVFSSRAIVGILLSIRAR